jgi:hypothetical protein
MPPAEVQIFFGTVLFVILCSVLVTQHFAAPETRWHVRLSVVVSLVTSASIVALVPFDVYTVRQRLTRSPRTLPAACARALRATGAWMRAVVQQFAYTDSLSTTKFGEHVLKERSCSWFRLRGAFRASSACHSTGQPGLCRIPPARRLVVVSYDELLRRGTIQRPPKRMLV